MLQNKLVRVWVGSQNPVKIRAVEQAFAPFFGTVEAIGVSVPSGVPDQPIGEDTFLGARRRAQKLLELNAGNPDAQFCVGVEGGVLQLAGTWFSLGAVCILDTQGREGVGASSWFPLPQQFVAATLAGQELGDAIDKITGERNTKQKGGAIGFLTRNVVDRTALYVQGVTMALVPFLNRGLFFEDPQ